MSATSSSGSCTTPPPKIFSWAEQDELCLLKAVREFAEEPVEAFDPTVCPFLRLQKSLDKPFSTSEILAKVKELRSKYEGNCRKIMKGKRVGMYDSLLFEISHTIWGIRVECRGGDKEQGE